MNDKAQHTNGAQPPINGSASDKQLAFISLAYELGQMFTQPAWHDREKVGKYLDDGLKPIEAFCNDIQLNLISWAIDSHARIIFYRTSDFWYTFQLVPASEVFPDPEEGYTLSGDIVWMTRHRIGSSERLDDWANLYSVEHVGRDFLQGYLDRRIPLFNCR